MIVQTFATAPRAIIHRPASPSKPSPHIKDSSQDTVSFKGPRLHKGYPKVETTEKPADADRWKNQILYFPMTDRFHDGDPDNNFDVDKSRPYGFHGGDLKGLTEKLDYIKELGATTIWVSPWRRTLGCWTCPTGTSTVTTATGSKITMR